jgi:hypothetical protein
MISCERLRRLFDMQLPPMSHRLLRRTITLGLSGLVLGACAGHDTKAPAPMRWDASTLPVSPQSATTTTKTDSTAAGSPISTQAWTGRRTFTANCAGQYALIETRTGRLIGSGGAFNTGDGLVTIDKHGRRGAKLPSTALNQTMTFLPDCNCPSGGQAAASTQASLPSKAPVCTN